MALALRRLQIFQSAICTFFVASIYNNQYFGQGYIIIDAKIAATLAILAESPQVAAVELLFLPETFCSVSTN